MKTSYKSITIFILILLFLTPLSCSRVRTVVFKNVTVVPMYDNIILENRDVYIKGSRIDAIVETGTRQENADIIIDGKGKYLMPGLADMHIHLYQDPKGSGLPLYVANGVTTVRDCNGRDFILNFKKEIDNGTRVGPRIYCTTYTIRGFENEPWRLVRERYKKGYDAVKFYSYFPSRTSFHKAMQEAKALHAYTIGHIPYKLGLAEIIEEGMNEVAHVEELAWEYADIDTSLTMAPNEWLRYIIGRYIQKYGGKSIEKVRSLLKPEAKEIALRLKGRNIPVSTTCYYSHMLTEKLFDPDAYIRTPYLKYLPVQYFINVGLGREKHQQQFREISRLIPVWQAMLEELLYALHEQDITIVGGTDALWDMGIVPGFSLHNELAYFVEIGFTPYEALRFCTVNAGLIAARMDGLQAPEIGTIEAGKLADMVLLEKNPLEEIAAVRKNCGVMANGRWYSPETCADLLAFDEKKHQDYLKVYEACRALVRDDVSPIVEFLEETPYDDITAAVYRSDVLSTEIIRQLKRSGDGESIKTFFHNAIEANWNNANYLNTLAWRAGHDMKITEIYPDAIRAVKRALELHEAAGIYDTLAWLYALNGDHEEAVDAIAAAKRLDPENNAWDDTLEKISKMNREE